MKNVSITIQSVRSAERCSVVFLCKALFREADPACPAASCVCVTLPAELHAPGSRVGLELSHLPFKIFLGVSLMGRRLSASLLCVSSSVSRLLVIYVDNLASAAPCARLP